jgi:hypothetical protein
MTGRRSAEEQNLSHLIAECGRLQWQGVRTKAGELPLWGMKTSSRLPARAAVVGLESGPRSTLQTARPAWGLLRAGDLPLLNAFKGAILASKPAGAS